LSGLAKDPQWKQSWRDIIVVHRLEYPLPVTYLCYATWGACFAMPDAGRLPVVVVLCAAAANLLLIVSALALNTAADIHTDRYQRERNYLASAALRFGRGRVLRWAAHEMIIAVVLVTLVWTWSGRWLVMGAAAAIIVLQVLYNLEPARLKRRGFVGVGAFCAAVVVLPFLLSYQAVRQDFDTWLWPILVGLGLTAAGRMTWWSVPDRAADAATGMLTPAVRRGAAGALRLACAIMLVGLILIAWGLWWRYGFAWVIPAITCHAGAIALLHRVTGEATPSSVRLQRHALPLVMIGDLALAITPLVAG
jgi:4-hydroxybenzoate polyprenyltransferase